MHRSSLVALVAAILLVACSAANADGPFEPNETGGEAYGPLPGGTLSAALETPQDHDWYRFYARGHSQIGVLISYTGGCSSSYYGLQLAVLDADVPGYSGTMGTATVGTAYPAYGQDTGNVVFTSIRGHRYYVKVTQTGCVGATYDVDVAPTEDLTQTLEDTAECTLAKAVFTRSNARLRALRYRATHGREATRRKARRQAALQHQTVAVDFSAAVDACTRPPLQGYPWS